MIFTATSVECATIIDLEARGDERGSLARAFCADEFTAQGIDPTIAQMQLNRSRQAGTLRGLHVQHAPQAETELVRCTTGLRRW